MGTDDPLFYSWPHYPGFFLLLFPSFWLLQKHKNVDTNSLELYNGTDESGMTMKAMQLYQKLRQETDQLMAGLEKVHLLMEAARE